VTASAGLLADTGAQTLAALAWARGALGLPVRGLVSVLRRPREGGRAVYDELLRQIVYTGVEGLDVTAFLGLAVGAIITAQTLAFVNGTSSQQILGDAMRLVVVRELGPLLTAIIVIARSGSSITVDLGNAVQRGELELMESMGVDPVRYLVVPRLIGVTVSTVCLGLAFDVFAVIGGFFASRLIVATPLAVVLSVASNRLDPADVWLGVAKCAAFGLVIATIATFEGLSARGTALELPRATRRSVVYALVACVGIDVVATVWTYRGMAG
jgi:phospholipid/cholesterol/gamma-HCH transport system permease protein